ncbi:MAG: hypothetical protein M3N53_00380 [Actinomycetota bacterium]|nr:hypothetical protein [Actinomycetota bacterium]
MISNAVAELQESHAFDPAPRRFDLGVYHVPFDSITKSEQTEAVLARSVRVPERVGLVGASGSGKSSVIAHVLGPMEEDIAPIRIPVAAENPETIVSPEAFARHVVRTVSNYARDAALMTEDDRRRILEKANESELFGGDARKGRVALTPGWMAGKAELSAELSSASAAITAPRSGSEIIEQAGRVIDVVSSAHLIPIIVIDDSDSWLNVVGLEDRTHLVNGFFGPVTRMLAEELNAAVVLAVHETYLSLDGFRQAEGFIETTVHIPAVPNEAALRAIVGKRVTVHIDSSVEDVISDDAMRKVFKHYTGTASGNLRKTLLVCHTALQAAYGDGADIISSGHVDTALAELSP